LTIDRIWQ